MRSLLLLLFGIGIASLSYAQVPTAQFSADQLTVCAGFPINFTNESTYGGATVISTNWDFGEGGLSNVNNPTYTYTSAGTYQVLLTVISSGGTDFELKLNYITVYPNPASVFSTSGNGCTVPFDVTFTNSSEIGADITYSWDFGNGQTSALQNPPAVTYGTDGTYPVSLIVTNTVTGCTTTSNQSLVVSDYAAGINAPLFGCVGEPVVITDASTVGVNSWTWTSGDGQFSIVQNPSFTYNIPGTYTISLTSQNSASGCSGNATQDIVINNPPNPSFTSAPNSGCAPLDVTYTNTSAAGTFEWDFGDGQTFSGQNPPVQTYNANGAYTVSLTMTDATGCDATTTIANLITVSPPIPNFGADEENGCAPLAVQFSDFSSSANPIDDPIVSWQWDFGNGQTFVGQNPPAQSYGLGTYDVSLTITTQNGCTEVLTRTDFIQVGMIDLVDFSLFPIEECAKQDIEFQDLSIINTPHDPDEVLYTWDFGDGGSSTEQNPIYNYPIDTGFFDIQLIVDFRGCQDTLSRTDQVFIKAPISLFTVPALYCNPTSFPVHVEVTDNAIAGAATDDVDMIWSWGVVGDPDDLLDATDVFDANQGDTAHDYTTYGIYAIKQVVHNYTTGCTDSTTQLIFISQMIPDFTFSNDTVCTLLDLNLASTSVFSDPQATYTYDMGNGTILTGDPIVYNYPLSGIYDITMIATNAVGCSDTITYTNFNVLDQPVAALTASDDTGCLPITALYTNQSATQGNGVPLSSFLWTFPDGSTQTTDDVDSTTSYDFTSEGFFTTSLVSTDIFGCVSPPATVTMLITNPTVDFLLNPVVCDEQVYNATNTTTGFGFLTYEWQLDSVFQTADLNFSGSFDETPGPGYTHVDHSVTLIATDANGCRDTITKIIQVDLPKADLSYVASGATANGFGEYTCPPVFETYTDLSTSLGTFVSWQWIFGDGKSSTFQNPNNTYVFPGTYTLSLSIVDQFGCTADTTLLDYLTILGPTGDLSVSSVGDICEHNYLFLAENLTFVDSIVWDFDDGTFEYDSTSIVHNYAVGPYTATGTLIDSLGCEVTYPLDIVVPPIVLTVDAGPDQAFCGDSTSLAGNIPPFGTGNWTIISGIGIFSDPSSPTTSITGLGIGITQLEWRITNACESIADTLEILITDASTLASAGADQFLCSPITVLAGNSPAVGVGTWTLVSGTGAITDANDPATTITAMNVGNNQFVWTIQNVCSISTDTVLITVETIPTVANAGSDQQVCGINATLEGNAVLVGTGSWVALGGTAVITDPSSPTTAITGLSLGDNLFEWTISNSCGSTSDTVIITGVNAPTTALAGPDQIACATDALLAGNPAVVGVGSWTLISGTAAISDPFDSLSPVSALGLGVNVFEWTINSLCGVTSDQVTITIEDQPSVADAGPDQAFCGNSTDLEGVIPTVGTGQWMLFSGDAIIADSSIATTNVSGLAVGDNYFIWTIANSCDTIRDTVMITSVIAPTNAFAGTDTTYCGTDGIFAGNDPLVGDGLWTLISGAATITTPSDSSSTITNLAIGENVFEWSISNLCSTSTDTVIFTIETTPTPADAGLPQTICVPTTNLAATTAAVGTGLWTLVSGSGIIATPNSPTTLINALGTGVNTFEWTVSNTCDTTSDQVEITLLQTPTVPAAGEDQNICADNTVLEGNTAVVGTGLWTLLSGSATIVSPNDPLSQINNLGVGANILNWTIFNQCATSLDPVTITVETTPPIATAGPDTTVCGTRGTLDGNAPLTGSGTWTITAGSGSINTISDSTSGITNLGVGINIFEWTVENSCSSSTAQMIITNTGECPDEDSVQRELVFYVPNTFTPNGDPHNQTFQPIFYSGYEPFKFTLYIFNRWGELVFESHNADIGWAGRYGVDGKFVQNGTYTWKIIYTDVIQQKEHLVVGHVNMLR